MKLIELFFKFLRENGWFKTALTLDGMLCFLAGVRGTGAC